MFALIIFLAAFKSISTGSLGIAKYSSSMLPKNKSSNIESLFAYFHFQNVVREPRISALCSNGAGFSPYVCFPFCMLRGC